MPRSHGGRWSTVDELGGFTLLSPKVCNFLSQSREPRLVKYTSHLGDVLPNATKLFIKL